MTTTVEIYNAFVFVLLETNTLKILFCIFHIVIKILLVLIIYYIGIKQVM